jgi:hypothetical protein
MIFATRNQLLTSQAGVFRQNLGARAFHPSTPSVQISSEFWQRNFLKRITPFQKEELIHKIKAQPKLSHQSQNIRDIFERNWKSPLFQTEAGTLTALQMYKENLLNDEEMSHIFLYDSSNALNGFQCYNTKTKTTWHEILRLGFKRLDDPKMDRAILSLQSQLPSIDLEVFSYRVPYPFSSKDGSFNKTETNLHQIFYLNYFMPIIQRAHTSSRAELETIILPPKLFSQLLCNRFPDPIKPIPVLGHRSVEKLSNPDKRVMSISSRFSPALKVHHIFCQAHPVMYVHDMYHLFIESANPHRKPWIELALFIGELKNSSNPRFDVIILDALQKKMLDREFSRYLMNDVTISKTNPNEIFFTLLENFPSSFHIEVPFWHGPNGLYNVLIAHIGKTEEKWKKEYGIHLPNNKF